MIRINLLPPEIIEKRKAERRWFYFIVGAIAVFAVVFVFYGVMAVRVGMQRGELAKAQQEAKTLQQQAARFAIFEQKKQDLAARTGLVNKALGNRINYSKLFSEISLVLPSDIWLSTLKTGDAEGAQMGGFAIDSDTDTPDVGHKSIAGLLVRLTDLEQLYDVWLSNSQKTQLEGQPVVEFSASAKISLPTTQTSAPSVPAPPSSGQ